MPACFRPFQRLFILVVFCWIGTTATAYSQERWYTHPDSVENLPVYPYHGMQIIADRHGGFYLKTPWPFSFLPYILYHFDENGASTFPDPTYVWCYPYENEIGGYPRSLFALDDGSLFYSMLIHNGLEDQYETHLMRVDQEGNQLWGPSGVAESGDWRYQEIARATDNSIWALRYVSADVVEDIRYELVQYDYQGNQLHEDPAWVVNSRDQGYVRSAFKLVDDENGGVYVCGTWRRDNDHGFCINHIDANGTIADTSGLRYFEYLIGGEGADYWIGPNGDLFGANSLRMIRLTRELELVWPEGARPLPCIVENPSSTVTKFSQENGIFWTKVQLDNLVWWMACYTPEGELLTEFPISPCDFHVAEDGRLWAIIGEESGLEVRYKAFVYAQDSEGTPQDSVFLYDQPESTTSIGALCTDNRNGLEFALSTTYGPSGGLVGRVTSDGYLGFSPSETGISAENHPQPQMCQLLSNFHPNPTNGAVRFQLAGRSEYTISVYNILGKRILRQSYRGRQDVNEVSLDLAALNLSSGRYFVRVVDNKRSKVDVIHFQYLK
ncbi:T9SS type A sorting domain-containing protein [bacterium]|nr:T9SS type A sorting domain-containing protein [bacterium]